MGRGGKGSGARKPETIPLFSFAFDRGLFDAVVVVVQEMVAAL
jgi:hypothetical protein